MKSFAEYLGQYVGEKVAFLCVRFQYRGVLSEIGTDYLVLANARAVEVSGRTMSEAPEAEDPINGQVTIKMDAIEIFYQPKWCNAPLEVT